MFDFDEELDVKQTNITYPRVNNESVLEFVFPPHPNLFMRKNKIIIRGTIDLDQKYIPDNGLASKVSCPLFDSKLVKISFFQCSPSK